MSECPFTQNPTDVYANRIEDAMLTVEAAMLAEQLQMSEGGAVRSARGLLLRSTAWAKQQKSRVGVISAVGVRGQQGAPRVPRSRLSRSSAA
ncbi:MAG: hypothetical protein R3F61_25140 [Myxococcota bacterium]